jgi:cell division protein FtsA
MPQKSYITSIDLGSSHIAIVGCELFEGQEAMLKHLILSPSLGVDRGYISDTGKALASLKEALTLFRRKSRMFDNKVSLSIGGIGLSSQYVKTGIDLKRDNTEVTNKDTSELTTKAELLFAEKYPNKKILHVIPISYRVDDRDVLGSPVGMIGSRIEAKIIIVTIPEHHFDALVSIAEAEGLDIEDIIAAPLADSMACLSYEQKKQGCVLVNVGSETTQISTYEQGKLTSLKVIGLGSSDITNDLALGLTVPIEEAHDIKHGHNNDLPQKKVEEIINARVIDIVESVEKHLRSIKKNRLLPAGVVWTGNGSQIKGINDCARSILSIPSQSVAMSYQTKDKKTDTKLKPKFSTAYGLCKVEDSGNSHTGTLNFKKILEKLKYWLQQLKP